MIDLTARAVARAVAFEVGRRASTMPRDARRRGEVWNSPNSGAPKTVLIAEERRALRDQVTWALARQPAVASRKVAGRILRRLFGLAPNVTSGGSVS